MFTAFQWTVFVFFFTQGIATVKFFMWVVTSINRLDTELLENSKRDKEIKDDITELKKDEKRNERELSNRLDTICQGLVRVETNVKNIQNQLDKK